MTREEAQAFVDAVVKLRAEATDKEASAAVGVYPYLHEDGRTIEAGTRINFGGVLKRAAVTLFDTAENSPVNAPNLWEDILYREGERIIPEVITPGLKFGQGEKGWWKDKLYESKVDNNTWTPETNPEFWKEI